MLTEELEHLTFLHFVRKVLYIYIYIYIYTYIHTYIQTNKHNTYIIQSTFSQNVKLQTVPPPRRAQRRPVHCIRCFLSLATLSRPPYGLPHSNNLNIHANRKVSWKLRHGLRLAAWLDVFKTRANLNRRK